MAAEKKNKPIIVMLSPTQLDELDSWRFENKIWSRGEAIRRLVFESIAERRAATIKPSKKPSGPKPSALDRG